MKKKIPKHIIPRNIMAKAVRSPLYRKRIVESKKKKVEKFSKKDYPIDIKTISNIRIAFISMGFIFETL